MRIWDRAAKPAATLRAVVVSTDDSEQQQCRPRALPQGTDDAGIKLDEARASARPGQVDGAVPVYSPMLCAAMTPLQLTLRLVSIHIVIPLACVIVIPSACVIVIRLVCGFRSWLVTRRGKGRSSTAKGTQARPSCRDGLRPFLRARPLYHAPYTSVASAASLLLLLSFALGYGFPALIALSEKAFEREGLINKVSDLYPGWKAQLAAQSARDKSYTEQRKLCSALEALRDDPHWRWKCKLFEVGEAVLNAPHENPSELERAGKLVQLYRGMMAVAPTDPATSKDTRLRVDGFRQNAQQHIYTWGFFLMGALLVLLRPCSLDALLRSRCAWLVTSWVMLVFTRWPHWWRWQDSDHEARRIFSFSHLDLYPWSALYNEAQVALTCVILAGISVAWMLNARRVRARTKPISNREIFASASDLATEFHRWRISSLVLAASFTYATAVYWRIIWVDADSRYLVSAFLIHGLWAYVWLCMTLPLIEASARWRKMRRAARFRLVSAGSDAIPRATERRTPASGNKDVWEMLSKEQAGREGGGQSKQEPSVSREPAIGLSFDQLQALQPIPRDQAIFAGVFTFASFVGPLIQALFQR